jgi:hypothetical protein
MYYCECLLCADSPNKLPLPATSKCCNTCKEGKINIAHWMYTSKYTMSDGTVVNSIPCVSCKGGNNIACTLY